MMTMPWMMIMMIPAMVRKKEENRRKKRGVKIPNVANRLQKPQKREEKSYSNLSIFC